MQDSMKYEVRDSDNRIISCCRPYFDRMARIHLDVKAVNDQIYNNWYCIEHAELQSRILFSELLKADRNGIFINSELDIINHFKNRGYHWIKRLLWPEKYIQSEDEQQE